MSNQQAPALPDLNVGQYPFELIQELVDQVAWINMFAMPDANAASSVISAPASSEVIGWQGQDVLHRFEIDLQRPSLSSGVQAINTVGQAAGNLSLRLLIIPQDFEARPDRTPPPTVVDPLQSQRFAIQEGAFSFGGGQDGFQSFGAGRTFPSSVAGQPRLVAAAIGNIMNGFGKFSGLQGAYVLSGVLTLEQGFVGNILIRAVDPDGKIRTNAALPSIEPQPAPDPATTYLIWRNQKTGPNQKTTYNFAPNGELRGVNVNMEMRRIQSQFTAHGAGGIQSHFSIGDVVGSMNTFTAVNPIQPSGGTGSGLAPFRFQGIGEFEFVDAGGDVVGTVAAQFLEGRTFGMQLQGAPGQPAVRFGFFGPIVKGSGTGAFQGAEGLLLGNTGTGIAPHVFSNLYVLRLHDPEGRWRAMAS